MGIRREGHQKASMAHLMFRMPMVNTRISCNLVGNLYLKIVIQTLEFCYFDVAYTLIPV